MAYTGSFSLVMPLFVKPRAMKEPATIWFSEASIYLLIYSRPSSMSHRSSMPREAAAAV